MVSLVLQVVGAVWMIVVGLLIAMSALVYANDAESLWEWLMALSDFFDPTRVLNSMLILAMLLPGYGIYQAGANRRRRDMESGD